MLGYALLGAAALPFACRARAPTAVTATIGPDGGTLTSPWGASLTVPPGALSSNTTLEIDEIQSGYPDVPAGLLQGGEVFAFLPHGFSSFMRPVTVVVPFTGPADAVQLYTAEPGEGWSPVPGATISGGALQAQVAHFSFFMAMTSAGGVADGGGVHGEGGPGSLDASGPSGTPPSPVTALAASDMHTCALHTDGTVSCWGDDGWGELGLGGPAGSMKTRPQTVVGLSGVTAIAAPSTRTFAATAGGPVYAWGSDVDGLLGNGSACFEWSPIPLSGPSSVSFLAGIDACGATGCPHACAVDGSNSLWCWGANSSGQIGDGTTNWASTPLNISFTGVSTGGTIPVATGGYHTCALRTYVVWCWGDNSSGQLGDGTYTSHASPTPTSIPLSTTMYQVVAGEAFTCAAGVGPVLCWGDNMDGEIAATGTTKWPTPSPIPGTSAATNQIAAAWHTACAVMVDGSVECWGDLSWGDGSGYASSTPQAIPGLAGVKQLVLGGSLDHGTHACALLGSGAVVCWGANDEGQLGDGTTTQRSTPAPVDW